MTLTFPKTHTSSLTLVADTYSLRFDAKQADSNLRDLLAGVTDQYHFYLSELLPAPFVKGVQPDYLDQPTTDSVPVVNTLSIQRLSLNICVCRHITREDFEALNDERRIKKNDVLLTVDGGVSIGKPCLFDLDDDFTIDSHVVILRPKIIRPLSLVYLLASQLGQAQFRKAESGSSGQTTVTEDDIRRFVFPRKILDTIDEASEAAEAERLAILQEYKTLARREAKILEEFGIL